MAVDGYIPLAVSEAVLSVNVADLYYVCIILSTGAKILT